MEAIAPILPQKHVQHFVVKMAKKCRPNSGPPNCQKARITTMAVQVKTGSNEWWEQRTAANKQQIFFQAMFSGLFLPFSGCKQQNSFTTNFGNNECFWFHILLFTWFEVGNCELLFCFHCKWIFVEEFNHIGKSLLVSFWTNDTWEQWKLVFVFVIKWAQMRCCLLGCQHTSDTYAVSQAQRPWTWHEHSQGGGVPQDPKFSQSETGVGGVSQNP